MCGAVISAKGKMQKTTALSITTEVKFIAGCDGIQDVFLAAQIFKKQVVKSEHPIIWKTDNIGAAEAVHTMCVWLPLHSTEAWSTQILYPT